MQEVYEALLTIGGVAMVAAAYDAVEAAVVNYRWGKAEKRGGPEGLKHHIYNSPISRYSCLPITERIKKKYYDRAKPWVL